MTRRDPGLLQLKHGALLVFILIFAVRAAPVYENEQTALESYDGVENGCYYNYNHYGEGDRIVTNEPCLNCTCHNRMLMCYLRVCPFTKPIGQDCVVEKREDQCCPVITCPEAVPVELVDNSSTTVSSTDLALPDNYGCSINGKFYAEGAQVPSNSNKPCELCYCIRNMTACVMQECTLHIDGCQPIYNKGVCCPVRYSCDHESDVPLLDDHSTTTIRPTEGFILTTPKTDTQECLYSNITYSDGSLIKTEDPCKHCYCMKGDIVCAVPECGEPLEHEDCVAQPAKEGQCCPDTYICNGSETVTIPPDSQLDDHQQHVVPQKSPVKGGTDIKRKGHVPEKPKDTKVDKSSEEDSEEEFASTLVPRTEPTIATTGKSLLDEDQLSIEPATTIQSDEEEKLTESPMTSEKEKSTERTDIAKPGHVDDRFSEDETTIEAVTEKNAADETAKDGEQTTEEESLSTTFKPLTPETDEDESSGTGPAHAAEDKPPKTERPEYEATTLTYSEEQGLSKGEGVRGSAESGESTEDKQPTTENPSSEEKGTEIPHHAEEETSSPHILEVVTEMAEVEFVSEEEASATPVPSYSDDQKTIPPHVETPVGNTDVEVDETTLKSEAATTMIPQSEVDDEEATPIIPTESKPSEEEPSLMEDKETVPVTTGPVVITEKTEMPEVDLSNEKESSEHTEEPTTVKIESVTKLEIESKTTTETIVKPSEEQETDESAGTTGKTLEKTDFDSTEASLETTTLAGHSAAEDKTETEVAGELSTNAPEQDYAELPPKEIVTELPTSEEDEPEPVTISQKPMESDSHIIDETTPRSDEENTTVIPEESDEMNTVIPEKSTVQPAKSHVAETTVQPDQETEIEQSTDIPPQVPGEGDCLFNGITYLNSASIPTNEECLESCVCFNSIVRCKSTCDLESGTTESPTVDEEDTTAVVVEVTKPSAEVPAIVKEIYPTEAPILSGGNTGENEIDTEQESTVRSIVKAPLSPESDETEFDAPTTVRPGNAEYTTISDIVTSTEKTVKEESQTPKESDETEFDAHTTVRPENTEYTTLSDIVTSTEKTVSGESQAPKIEELTTYEPPTESKLKDADDMTEAPEAENPDQSIPTRSDQDLTEKPENITEKEAITEKADDHVTEQAEKEVTEQYATEKTDERMTEKPDQIGSLDPAEPIIEQEVTEQPPRESSEIIVIETTTTGLDETEKYTTDSKVEVPEQTTDVSAPETEATKKPVSDDDKLVEIEEPEAMTPTTVHDEDSTTHEVSLLSEEHDSQTTEASEVETEKHPDDTGISKPEDHVHETTEAADTLITGTREETIETTSIPMKTIKQKPGSLDDRLGSGEDEQDLTKMTTEHILASTEESATPQTVLPVLGEEPTAKPIVDEFVTMKVIDSDITTVMPEGEIILNQESEAVEPPIEKEVGSSTEYSVVDTTTLVIPSGEAESDESYTTLSSSILKESATEPIKQEDEEKGTESSLNNTDKTTERTEPHITDSIEQKTETAVHDQMTEKIAHESEDKASETETTENPDQQMTDKPSGEELEHKTEEISQPEEETTTSMSELTEELSTVKDFYESSTSEHETEFTTQIAEKGHSATTDSDSIQHPSVKNKPEGEEKEEDTTLVSGFEETTKGDSVHTSDDRPTTTETYESKPLDTTSEHSTSTDAVKTSTQKDLTELEGDLQLEVEKTTITNEEAVTEAMEEIQTTTVIAINDEREPQKGTVNPENQTTLPVQTGDEDMKTQTETQTTIPVRSQFDSSEDQEATTEGKIVDANIGEPQTDKSVEDEESQPQEEATTTEAGVAVTKDKIEPADTLNNTQKAETTVKSITEEEVTTAVTDATTIQAVDADVQATKKPHIEDIQKPIEHDHEIPEHPLEETYTTNAPVKSPESGLPQAGYPNYDEDYTEEDEDPTQFGPGTCRYGGKLYVSAQQIPRDDPCDFCFCFRSDIICLQQSCPPPIQNCHEEPISGFCCPRYECHVGMATIMNITTSTTTTTTTLPPHFVNSYKGAARKGGCLIQGKAYSAGEEVFDSSTPCMKCECGGDAQMKCEPRKCGAGPMLQQMIAAAQRKKR